MVLIDHTGLQASQPEVSRRFYEKALGPLGYVMMYQAPKEVTEGLAVLGFGIPLKPDF